MGPRGDSVRIGSLPGIRRLPFYLTILRRFVKENRKIISAINLAEESGQAVSVVKKDIEMTGAVGKTGVGYMVEQLIADIEDFLGWNNQYDAFLVGAGHLGYALLGYQGFKQYGLRFVAAFDTSPSLVGSKVHGVEVLAMDKLVSLARRMRIITGVITVPGEAAQEVCDLFVEAGIRRIWNFAPVMLSTPDWATVQREDLSAGLAELMVKCKANPATESAPPQEPYDYSF